MCETGQSGRLVQRLIWDVLNEQLSAAEGDVVRRVIGEAAIERNREVFEECNLYEELLGDLRANNLEASQGSSGVCSSKHFSLVEQEVSLWIERLRNAVAQTSNASSRSPLREQDLHLKSQASQQAMAYVKRQTSVRASVSGALRRPSTAAAHDASGHGSILQHACATRPSTASSQSSRASLASGYSPSLTDLPGPGGRALDAYNVDAVKADIQAALHAEHAALLEDVEYLQMLMNDDLDVSAVPESQPPELKDMQALVSHIRDITLHEEEQLAHVQRVDSMLQATKSSPSRLLSLRSQASISRGAHPSPPPPPPPPPPAQECPHREAHCSVASTEPTTSPGPPAGPFRHRAAQCSVASTEPCTSPAPPAGPLRPCSPGSKRRNLAELPFATPARQGRSKPSQVEATEKPAAYQSSRADWTLQSARAPPQHGHRRALDQPRHTPAPSCSSKPRHSAVHGGGCAAGREALGSTTERAERDSSSAHVGLQESIGKHSGCATRQSTTSMLPALPVHNAAAKLRRTTPAAVDMRL